MNRKEINKLIHEKLFGARMHDEMTIGYQIPLQPDFPNGGFLSLDTPHKTPNYCEDIAEAWNVLDRLQLLGFAASVTTPGFIYSWESGMYQCQLDHKNIFPGGGYIGKAETVELAICEAAVEAIESLLEKGYEINTKMELV